MQQSLTSAINGPKSDSKPQVLRIKPAIPKFSFEFKKWMDKQKEEDPTLHSNMHSVLKPPNQRD